MAKASVRKRRRRDDREFKEVIINENISEPDRVWIRLLDVLCGERIDREVLTGLTEKHQAEPQNPQPVIEVYGEQAHG